MPDPASPPSPTPRPAASGSGCLVALIALPFVIVIGLVIGKALSDDDGGDVPGEERATLDEGTLAGTAWRVDAVVDVEGDVCAFLYADDEQLTGACDQTPQDATFGDETVVFGVAGERERVAVELSDGEVVEIETAAAGDIAGRFYVTVVPGDVDAEGLAQP